MEVNKVQDGVIGIVIWWIPILIAIPIGIATNIITPRVQNWLATRSLKQTSKRISQLKAELDIVIFYQANTQKLYLKSANVVFLILFLITINSTFNILAEMFSYTWFIINESLKITHNTNYFSIYLINFLILLVSMFPNLIAVLITMNHIRLLNRINQIDEYKTNVTTRIKILSAKYNKRAKSTSAQGLD